MVKGEYDKKKYFIIKTIINSFKDLVSINRNNSNQDVNTNNNFDKKEYTSNDFDKKNVLVTTLMKKNVLVITINF